MDYADLCRLSFAPLERSAFDRQSGVWRFRDANGRIWTLTSLMAGDPGYDPIVDEASCGKCNRDLSPLDLPAEHKPWCKGAIVEPNAGEPASQVAARILRHRIGQVETFATLGARAGLDALAAQADEIAAEVVAALTQSDEP